MDWVYNTGQVDDRGIRHEVGNSELRSEQHEEDLRIDGRLIIIGS
jgi:hypothetical protein